jgi:hypothetical protein
MTFVRQKFKHCFVACIVSSLEDKKLQDDQTKIVDKFQNELQKGLPDEGVPRTTQEFDAVVTGLKLAHFVSWIHDGNQVKDVLLKNMNAPNDMYLMSRDSTVTTNHCVRIKKVTGDGVEVMNPEVGFETWNWEKINLGQCRLAVFLSAEDVARLDRNKAASK